MANLKNARHWIDGEWSSAGTQRQTINPATGDVIGHYADGGADTAQAAIDAAQAAFDTSSWRHDPFLRATVLCHLADAYEARIGEIVETLAAENGKMKYEAGFEAHFIARALRFAAGLAMQNFGQVAEVKPGMQAMAIREPVGVAGLIIPWNSPAYLSIRSLVPALAAGCTAAIKMPHLAAQTAQLMSEILASVKELPHGVVNLFIESGHEGAKLLVASPQVKVVSFTGSTATGRAIAKAAAGSFKRLNLELGGKTPHLIFEDADVDALLPVLEKSCTVFAGQFCMTGSRILVHRGKADAVRAGLAARLEAVRPGPASSPDSHMGPLIDKAAVARVNACVDAAIAAGAKSILRGGPSKDPKLAGGAFYHPTLLEVTDSTLAIVREETFGPVQTLQVFDTEEEAIRMANDSEYGLSACVWSRDIDRPIRVARKLQAGLVSINGWANLAIEFGEGGYKASGVGRLGGTASLDDFLESKQITQNFVPPAHP